MRLAEILTRHREHLLAPLVALAWEADPGGDAFSRRESDPFHNPVGSIVTGALRDLYDGLAAGRTPLELSGPVERLVQLRAVQEIAPSAAVSFPFLLGRALREHLPPAVRAEAAVAAEAFAEADRVERDLVLLAVDLYVACRERLHAGRLRAEAARVGALLRRLDAPPDAAEPAEAWAGGAP